MAAKIKKPQPGKNKTIRTQRRKVIAEKIVAQETPQKIAREIGISRQMVNVELRAPETQEFIRGAMEPHLGTMREMVPSALRVVRYALEGEPVTIESGDPLVPSKTVIMQHKMQDRLRGVKTLGYLMEMGEGRTQDGHITDRPTRFAGTMEELLVLYRKTTIEGSGKTSGA